jgi:hypothetical protein
MDYKILLVLLFLVSMIGISTGADFQSPMQNNTYYNVSYTQPSGSFIPLSIWIFIAGAGFYLLLISFLATGNQNSDIFGYLAVPVIGLATWLSTGLDIITGSGVTSQGGSFVMMEQHTIYNVPGLTIVFIVLFIVSILNIYRLIVINRDPDATEYEDSKA